MIRVVLFLVVVGALSFGFAWLADQQGGLVLTWHAKQFETSLPVAASALLAAMAALGFLFVVVRAIVLSPVTLARLLRNRRGVRAYEAISHGLIAVGSGDIEAARRHAAAVNRLAPGEPLALLLAAQSAQLAGDRDAAERVFRAMADRADTKPLGLHGLFVEAHRRNDLAGARSHAEEAVRTAPSLGWASRAVMEARVRDGDWAGALHLLEQNLRTLEKRAYRRLRAVLLTAHALALETADRARAKVLALEAQKLAPTLVPTAALAGRLLAEDGEQRKANRVIDSAWRANPHPELAQAYAELRTGEAARDRLARIEALAKRVPGHIEGALAVAHAALDAQEFAKARAALAAFLATPTKRIALLMAELERAEHNDVGRAREWLSRALHAAPDPAWTADGHVSDRWLPASPVTGRLDAFEWRVPLTGHLSSTTPVIETEPTPPPPPSGVVPSAPDAPATVERLPAREGAPPASPPSTSEVIVLPSQRAQPREPKPEPVIPLVHAPDDPGTEVVADEDTEEPQQDAKAGSWRKLFG
jgi:HemY protein